MECNVRFPLGHQVMIWLYVRSYIPFRIYSIFRRFFFRNKHCVFAFAAQYGGFSIFSFCLCFCLDSVYIHTSSRHSTSPRFDVINSFGISVKFLAHTLVLALMLSSTRTCPILLRARIAPSRATKSPIYL